MSSILAPWDSLRCALAPVKADRFATSLPSHGPPRLVRGAWRRPSRRATRRRSAEPDTRRTSQVLRDQVLSDRIPSDRFATTTEGEQSPSTAAPPLPISIPTPLAERPDGKRHSQRGSHPDDRDRSLPGRSVPPPLQRRTGRDLGRPRDSLTALEGQRRPRRPGPDPRSPCQRHVAPPSDRACGVVSLGVDDRPCRHERVGGPGAPEQIHDDRTVPGQDGFDGPQDFLISRGMSPDFRGRRSDEARRQTSRRTGRP